MASDTTNKAKRAISRGENPWIIRNGGARKEYAKKMSVKHDTKRTGFSKTAKDLLEPKKGEKHLKGYEY